MDLSGNAEANEYAYVHQVYDLIAPHFSHTRYKPWPKVEAFVAALRPGSVLADVGCGNGKYLAVLPADCLGIGSDRSANLLRLCSSHPTVRCDQLALSFRTASCDAAISIAVLHHLSTVPRRVAAIAELARILVPGGRCLIYVWSLENQGKRKRIADADALVPWHLQPRHIAASGQDVEAMIQQPVVATDKQNELVFQRYYHLFQQGELVDLVLQHVPQLEVMRHGFDCFNWYVECRRRDDC